MQRIIFLIFVICSAKSSLAQLTPLKSQYFNNPYLANPAMAGREEEKTNIFINYSSQWNKIEGSPMLMSLSANTSFSEQVGLGVNVISDKAGLLRRTQATGSFAYKLPLGEEQGVRFGISLAWTREQLDLGEASSTGSEDPALSNFNNKRKSLIDGNFGIAYINNALEVQFSYLNLNQKRSNEFSTVDYSTFYSAASYEFNREGSFSIKPLVAFRGIKGYKNQWDVASEFSFNQTLSLYTMYHSNQSFSGGAGYEYAESLKVSLIYNSEPSNVRGFTGGIIDLTVGYGF